MGDNHYKIKYHALSVVGNTRTHNEDNLFCDGNTRPVEDEETYSQFGEILSTDNKILAVFDGIGGEEKGEVASSIASVATQGVDFSGENVEEKIVDFARSINQRVRQYAVDNDIENMGTTFAGAVFSDGGIHIGNVGDSKVFKLHNGKITQLSVDHVLPKELAFNNVITQYIGMKEEKNPLDPAISFQEYSPGDRYIICSDGLTEKLNVDEVGALCHVAETVTDATDILVSQALCAGGNDNITVIVCELENI
ncbi:MAG: PP2C family protein-serine/threonine phosphatase [Ruminococcus sp.]